MSDMSNRIFVGGLDHSIDEVELERHFKIFGDILQVLLMRDRETQKPRGFAFISFRDVESANDAIQRMHGVEINGRCVSVRNAEREKTQSFRGGSQRGGGYRGRGRGGFNHDFNSSSRGNHNRSDNYNNRDRSGGRYGNSPPSYNNRGGRFRNDKGYENRSSYSSRGNGYSSRGGSGYSRGGNNYSKGSGNFSSRGGGSYSSRGGNGYSSRGSYSNNYNRNSGNDGNYRTRSPIRASNYYREDSPEIVSRSFGRGSSPPRRTSDYSPTARRVSEYSPPIRRETDYSPPPPLSRSRHADAYSPPTGRNSLSLKNKARDEYSPPIADIKRSRYTGGSPYDRGEYITSSRITRNTSPPPPIRSSRNISPPIRSSRNLSPKMSRNLSPPRHARNIPSPPSRTARNQSPVRNLSPRGPRRMSLKTRNISPDYIPGLAITESRDSSNHSRQHESNRTIGCGMRTYSGGDGLKNREYSPVGDTYKTNMKFSHLTREISPMDAKKESRGYRGRRNTDGKSGRRY